MNNKAMKVKINKNNVKNYQDYIIGLTEEAISEETRIAKIIAANQKKRLSL